VRWRSGKAVPVAGSKQALLWPGEVAIREGIALARSKQASFWATGRNFRICTRVSLGEICRDKRKCEEEYGVQQIYPGKKNERSDLRG